MQRSGRWELESHGRFDHENIAIDEQGNSDHFLSNKMWLEKEGRFESEAEYRERIAADMRLSRKDLEEKLGTEVAAFAFPFSDYGQFSTNIKNAETIVVETARQHYDMAFYQVFKSKGETFNYPEFNREIFMVKRINPNPEWTGSRLIEELESGRAKDLPYYNSDFSIEWKDSWGEARIGQDLWLRATNETSGASAFLNGSYLWGDYVFTANINWFVGSNVILMARHRDNDNNYMCDFSEDKVKVRQMVNGSSNTLAEASYFIAPRQEGLPLSISVSGNEIECLVNDDSVVRAYGSPELSNGGVGIQIWDSLGNRAVISVNFVEARQIQ
jgi:hypothetical protein